MINWIKKVFSNKENKNRDVNRRGESRIICSETTEFTNARGEVCSCKILNVSPRGLRITTGKGLARGEVLNFLSPAYNARVIWVIKNIVGLRIVK